MKVKPIPEGYHSVTPYLVVEGASELINFLKKAFNAEELHKTTYPDGKVMHSEVRIGDSIIMITDATPKMNPSPVTLYLYVNDVDSTYKQSVKAGGISTMEPADQFYGDRNAGIKDQWGNNWWIATHVEDVSPEEMHVREEAQTRQKR